MKIIDGTQLWALHATHGFPLEVSVPMVGDHDAVPDWLGLFRAARRDGVNVPALVRRLDAIVGDAYPPPIATAIRERLALMPAYLAAHP